MRIVIEIDQGDAVTQSSTTATVEPAQDVDAGAAPAPAATTESAPLPGQSDLAAAPMDAGAAPAPAAGGSGMGGVTTGDVPVIDAGAAPAS